MAVKIDGLDALSRNIATIVSKKVPNAASKSINKLARTAMNGATKEVANYIGVPNKTIRSRSKLMQRARRNAPTARIRVIRSNMPAIRLLENRSNRIWEGSGAITVGKYAVRRGFKQVLKNGRIHIMQRRGRARYSIDVVKIPLAQPLTKAFEKQLANYQKDIANELSRSLSEAMR